jgi:selenocysteine lyase/cysteine desulfurase
VGAASRNGAGRRPGLSGQADELAFVAGTSDGLSSVATAFDWRPGIGGGGGREFPANVYPWVGAPSSGRTSRAHRRRLTVDAIAALIDDSTRVVSVSAVDFATGQRRPLAAIGDTVGAAGCSLRRRHPGAGALRVDVARDGIDALAADGHKWLCAPEGCGVLYVSRRWLDRLVRSGSAGRAFDASRYLPYHFELKTDAQKFECGSSNFLAIHALGAAIDLMFEVGVDEIERRVLALTDRLRSALVARGLALVSPEALDERSGITTVRTAEAPDAVVRRLRGAGVLASPRGGGVRLSPHFYCNDDDVTRCLDALTRSP